MTLTVSPREFLMLRRYIEEQCGISLGDDKSYLIQNRLSNLALEYGCRTFGELYHMVSNARPSAELRDAILDAISTNETLWFRDNHPFRILGRYILPRLMEEINNGRRKRIAIWSAACSTGQEPYSIAMTALNVYEEAGRREKCSQQVSIIASDVSRRSLATAVKGIYSESTMKRGMNPMYLTRHFHKQGNQWQLSDEIREMISFIQYNLKDPPPRTLGSLDVVFLRNVIIYFSDEFKRSLFRKVATLMSPRGFLFLGTSETVSSYTDAFEIIEDNGNIFYRIKP